LLQLPAHVGARPAGGGRGVGGHDRGDVGAALGELGTLLGERLGGQGADCLARGVVGGDPFTDGGPMGADGEDGRGRRFL
jgi:hypothetical protein